MFTFTLLGPVAAARDGVPVPVGTPQQRAMLAVLLLHPNQVVPIGQVADAIWDDGPPPGAVAAIRTYASRLRRALEPVEIVHSAGGYRLSAEPGSIDLDTYHDLLDRARAHAAAGQKAQARDRYLAAQKLWAGTPLGGVPGRFAHTRRTVLEETRLAADLEFAELELDLHRRPPDALLRSLNDLVRRYPMRERPRELLMLALTRAGRRPEALTVFENGRDLLADRLGVDPGPGLLDAHERIVARTAALLPRDLADFTGRAELLRTVVDTLREGTPVGLYGPAELGKSAIAVHAAHLLRDEHPDGQYYADLDRTDLPAALAQFLRAQGDDVPPGFAERVRSWTGSQTGRRPLVVLDHVRTSAQLTPLPPGSTLITAREVVHVPGVRWFEVPPMTVAESVALLDRIVGGDRVTGEPLAARRLALEAGGNPARLRMAGARIASRPQWTLPISLPTN